MRIRRGRHLGKYRIERLLGEGAFAAVYRARDTVEGTQVALKVADASTRELREDLLKEVRVLARLDHPHILPLKSADFIDGRLAMAHPLGDSTLADRLRRRLGGSAALEIAEQLLVATAYAHSRRIIHCDIKPENVILFEGVARLGDFGIARIAQRTRVRSASGRGTLGYVAPEQALGKPSFRSDVFSLGLVLYRMLAGTLPEWPFHWPPPNIDRLRRAAPKLVPVLRKAMQVDERKRYRHAGRMLEAFRTAIRHRPTRSRTRQTAAKKRSAASWEAARVRQFRREFAKPLGARAPCPRCAHPIAEEMIWCPWCAWAVRKYAGPVKYRSRCRRCGRGVRADWRFCAFCYGAQVHAPEPRRHPDPKGTPRCRECRGPLPRFARYCPSCRAKARRVWRIAGTTDRCGRCRWGTVKRYWRACPWCGKRTPRKATPLGK